MQTNDELTEALGAICPEGWTLAVAEDGTRVLAKDEDEAYSFLIEEGAVPLLYMRTKVCDLPKTDDPSIMFEDILGGNFFWRETDGATLSVHADGVYLTARMACGAFGDRALPALVERFAATRRDWRERIRLAEVA